MADETALYYRGFDIWMMGDNGRGCIAINGRSVKRFPIPATHKIEWDVLKGKAKVVIDQFWEQDAAQNKYVELCQNIKKREKDYYL